MRELLKRIASSLPMRTQQELKRANFRRHIRAGRFLTAEPEYGRLGTWIRPGDWVWDVGANVGHYTLRMAELAGPQGRVFAFEPVPETFELLAANVAVAGAHNVSLFNVAVSLTTDLAGISFPRFSSGLTNYYMASLVPEGGEMHVLTLRADSLMPPKPVTLVKLDVEGHELPALRGMQELLRRDHPRLIVEGRSDEVLAWLRGLGYEYEEDPSSPNRVFFSPRC